MSTPEQQSQARQAFYRDQQKSREDFYGNLGKFAEKTLEQKREAKVAAKTEPKPTPKVVERRYSTLSTPARPIRRPEKKKVSEPSAAATVATPSSGAFFSMYLVTAGPSIGDTFLQGGGVSGGNGGSVSIADIKVIDSVAGPVFGAGTVSAGTVLYLKASCEATVSDGIMLPGCKLLSAVTTTTGGTNHTFTTTSATGFLYLELGRWTDDSFLPAEAGNKMASGCIGNFNLT